MALRSIEITLPEGRKEQIEELLSERKEALDVRMQRIIGVWKHPVRGVMYSRLSEEQILVKILVFAEESESLLKSLQEKFSDEEGFRINIIPVEASIPVEEMEAKSSLDIVDNSVAKEKKSFRLSREELYEDISTAAMLTGVYVVLVILSSIVAAIGLWNNSVAIIIGAMVIAPLLGPNVALSLAAALGDIKLARNALKTNVIGLAIAAAFSIIMGYFLAVDPTIPEIESRTVVGLDDVLLALVSGCAGTLAFTSGAPATLIGVAVAVALLPPLVTSGLLLGSGYTTLAYGAFVLFLVNIISINLAGVGTFLVQGISPWNRPDDKMPKQHLQFIALVIVGLLAILSIAVLRLWETGLVELI